MIRYDPATGPTGNCKTNTTVNQDTGETFTTNYELNDTLYAKAEITPSNTVYLWLGANVMLEYTTEEALSMLAERLKVAKQSLATCEEDLEFCGKILLLCKSILPVYTTGTYNTAVTSKQRKENK